MNPKDRSDRLAAQCISGSSGAGITLVFDFNGVDGIRVVGHACDYMIFGVLDLAVVGDRETEGIFDNAVMREG
jgi:hypothetical protein